MLFNVAGLIQTLFSSLKLKKIALVVIHDTSIFTEK